MLILAWTCAYIAGGFVTAVMFRITETETDETAPPLLIVVLWPLVAIMLFTIAVGWMCNKGLNRGIDAVISMLRRS